jgi:hypothetical protein
MGFEVFFHVHNWTLEKRVAKPELMRQQSVPTMFPK